MAEKIIKVGDKNVKMKSSAAVLRLYRDRFQKDLLKDFDKLYASAKNGKTIEFSELDIEIIENLAYIMASHADPKVAETEVAEWLEQFGMMDLFAACDEIIKLWLDNAETLQKTKKKEKKTTT